MEWKDFIDLVGQTIYCLCFFVGGVYLGFILGKNDDN